MWITERLWTEEKKRRFIELNELGLSQYEIGEALGMRPNTVKNVRARFGVIRRRPDLWSSANEESLKLLWAEGKSGGEIAKIFGGAMTRNAVIGKVHRMGLPARKVVTRVNPAKPRPRRIVKHKTVQKRLIRDGKLTEAVSLFQLNLPPTHADNPCNILDLNGCRWPCEGSGLETVFCGGQKFGEQSYCARHYRMSINPRRR